MPQAASTWPAVKVRRRIDHELPVREPRQSQESITAASPGRNREPEEDNVTAAAIVRVRPVRAKAMVQKESTA
jgi:hypothetical protein